MVKKNHFRDFYLKDPGEVSIHWPFSKLRCNTVVHFDLRNTSNTGLRKTQVGQNYVGALY